MASIKQIGLLLSDKGLKPKEKTETLAGMIASGEVEITDLINYAENTKDPIKATCMEAFEFASHSDGQSLGKEVFEFAVRSLGAKAPRVKWEAAKVIGNLAPHNISELTTAIPGLLENSTHEGTVVRWSAAYALGEIIQLKTDLNPTLIPALEKTAEAEEKNSIKKIYLAALKKAR